MNDVLFSRRYEFTAKNSPSTGLPQLLFKSFSKNAIRVTGPESSSQFRHLTVEEVRDGVLLDRGCKVEIYERGPIFLFNCTGSVTAPFVGRLSQTTCCWRLVGRRYDRGGQRHHHGRENLIGVRATLISNQLGQRLMGADDLWYPTMRKPPLASAPFD